MLAFSPFHTLLIYFGSGVIITKWKAELNEIDFVSHATEWIAKYPRYQLIRPFWK
ncbi:MAG TPA: hypothetical protein VGH00_08415 [Chthoniobacterales bacterium]